MGYQDEVLAIRQQRAQRDIAEAQESIKERYQVAVQERDQAAAQGYVDGYENWDRECETLEDEWESVAPPPPPQAPQLSEPTKRYLNERQAFNQRYGAAATAAYKAAHEFAVQRGLRPDTVEYFKYVDDALELHGRAYNGVRFDPSEKVPHPNEVCHMLGLSYDEYNRQHRKMHAEGRDSNSQAKAQWGKPVG
jgi:hypothetical protein